MWCWKISSGSKSRERAQSARGVAERRLCEIGYRCRDTVIQDKSTAQPGFRRVKSSLGSHKSGDLHQERSASGVFLTFPKTHPYTRSTIHASTTLGGNWTTMPPARKENKGFIPNRFAGQVALVVGGAHGIGKAIAVGLAQEGATMVIADMERTSLPTPQPQASAPCFAWQSGGGWKCRQNRR